MKKNISFDSKLLVQTIVGMFAISIFAMVFTIWIYFDNFSGNLSPEQNIWGAFGDFFGGTLNPIFSFLAFVILVLTLVLQRNQLEVSAKELELSRTELTLTKNEVAISADALHEQNLNLKTQRFENTLFNMLDLLTKVKNEIVIIQPQTRLNGKHAIESIYSEFKNSLANYSYGEFGEKTKIQFKNEYKSLDEIKIYYEDFYNNMLGKNLEEYFRLTYQLLKFFDDSVDIQNKKFYSNILRAQLSKHEQCLLLYHTVSNISNEGLRPLIKKYNLLAYLDINEIWEEHRYLVDICNE